MNINTLELLSGNDKKVTIRVNSKLYDLYKSILAPNVTFSDSIKGFMVSTLLAANLTDIRDQEAMQEYITQVQDTYQAMQDHVNEGAS